MSEFDAIRPYHDDEVAPVLQRLIRDEELVDSIIRLKFGKSLAKAGFLLRPVVRGRLRKQFGAIHTVAGFQAEIETYLEKVLNDTIDDLTVSGLESLDPESAYLFISNHRDITMDPALVNLVLYRAGFSTLRIAIGDNLLTKPFASDLMRLNKSFIVNRSAKAPREKFQAAKLLSSYIHHSVMVDNENVWIAQREGRAKDGRDLTNSAIISMLAMSRDKSQTLADYIRDARVVPVSISYEFDPCDADKARELTIVKQQGKYEKQEHEDVQSIARGITGYKGRVHLAFGEQLSGEYETAEEVTAELDRQISANYRLHSTNMLAYNKLEGHWPELDFGGVGERFDPEHFKREQRLFKSRLEAIPAEYHTMLLEAYANPVRGKLHAG